MRQRLLIGISAVCLIVAGAGIMSVAAVDRDEAAQNAAIDRLNCETFGEDCATPEPDATDVPATATQPQEPTLAGCIPRPTMSTATTRRVWATAFSQQHFGHGIIYGGDETSGPMERDMKHEAFKGILIPLQAGGQAYFRYHAASNPMDRAAQFHSYEVYIRDTAGNVSFFQGLYDTGDPEPYPAGDRVPRSQGDPGQRPIMLVVDQAAWNAGIRCEQWYAFGNGGWASEFAITICNSTTLYVAGENATAHDQSAWVRSPDNGYGLNRRAEVFWYPSRVQGHTGWFCAEPGGDALPGNGTATGCPTGSLSQYIAPTLAGDAGVNLGVSRIQGIVQKTFGCGADCSLPN